MQYWHLIFPEMSDNDGHPIVEINHTKHLDAMQSDANLNSGLYPMHFRSTNHFRVVVERGWYGADDFSVTIYI